MAEIFYCISYFDGDISWVESICGNNYVIYAKGQVPLKSNNQTVIIPNVGYNIYSYLTYIIDHYDSLPERIVFCKNNVFERHVSREVFMSKCSKKIFTPIEEPDRWDRINFPTSVISSDGGYLELNNNWYVTGYNRRYFSSFDVYYKFLFEGARRPDYLRFAPGANYLVPREHILIRSRNFYINLREFVSHSQLSCESHFVERSLIAIWSSDLKESMEMSKLLSKEDLDGLVRHCSEFLTRETSLFDRIKRAAMNRICAFAHIIFG
jgi:Protein of unknown function (DUF3431)